MGGAIGDILPLAFGIMVSPIPIIATILMLLSPNAKGTSVGFLLGWLVGITVAIVVFTLLSSVLPQGGDDGSDPVGGTIKIILGALLLFLGFRQWRGRPKPGETAKLPGWMAAIDKLTFVKAAGLAFLLAAVNPKNLLLAAAAGVTVGTSGLTVGEQVITIVVFVLIAGASVLIPVVAFLLASKRMAGPLDSLRVWLVHNNATVMAVLFFVLGVAVIGKGIGSF